MFAEVVLMRVALPNLINVSWHEHDLVITSIVLIDVYTKLWFIWLLTLLQMLEK